LGLALLLIVILFSLVGGGLVISPDRGAERGSDVGETRSGAPEVASTPDLVGRSRAEALNALDRLDLHASVTLRRSSNVRAGTVLAQRPTAGSTISPDSTVTLAVASRLGEPKRPKHLDGSSAAQSISRSKVRLTWLRPTHGPRPTEYLVYRDGSKIATVRPARACQGRECDYRDKNAEWGEKYEYVVRSGWKGTLSAGARKLLVVAVPPISESRLEGSASLDIDLEYFPPFAERRYLEHAARITFEPKCAKGACAVSWTAAHSGRFFNGSTGGGMSRSGSIYTGVDSAPTSNRCGKEHVPTTLQVVIQIVDAEKQGSSWAAVSFVGSMTEYTNWPRACGGNTQRTAYWTFSGRLR
jgi:hypothetical protein